MHIRSSTVHILLIPIHYTPVFVTSLRAEQCSTNQYPRSDSICPMIATPRSYSQHQYFCPLQGYNPFPIYRAVECTRLLHPGVKASQAHRRHRPQLIGVDVTVLYCSYRQRVTAHESVTGQFGKRVTGLTVRKRVPLLGRHTLVY